MNSHIVTAEFDRTIFEGVITFFSLEFLLITSNSYNLNEDPSKFLHVCLLSYEDSHIVAVTAFLSHHI
jgi:hypothetical protein